MRIVDVAAEPLHRINYSDAAPGGGTQLRELPILRVLVEGLPRQLDALLVTSDLQGRAPLPSTGGTSELLGEALAEEYATLADLEQLPPPELTGVILAGDLFAAPGADRMGATGDVRSVWRAFAERFRWVAGVAGNHDLFGSSQDLSRFSREPGIFLLDGGQVSLDDLRIAGVGGICGNKGKPNRRPAEEFVATTRRVLQGNPHLLVLHEGPAGGEGQRGNAALTAALAGRRGLVICGHCHWNRPLAELPGGGQVLNADARAFVLERAD